MSISPAGEWMVDNRAATASRALSEEMASTSRAAGWSNIARSFFGEGGRSEGPPERNVWRKRWRKRAMSTVSGGLLDLTATEVQPLLTGVQASGPG